MTVVEINFRTLSKISLFVRRGVRPECVMKRAVKAELILAAFVQCFQVVNIFKGGAHVVHIGYTVLKKLLLCGKQSIFSPVSYTHLYNNDICSFTMFKNRKAFE